MAATTSTVVKEGILWKREGSSKDKGGGKKKWNKRYFIFTGGSFYVYVSPTV